MNVYHQESRQRWIQRWLGRNIYGANLKVPEPVLVVQTEIAVFSDRDGQGKLLLIHGEMDENVHYSLTMKLVRTTADIVVVSQSIDGSI
jgi:hypothetical protein